ncbi:hypothetical protein [Microbacterium trichothecenolyticum]|uniref:Uncharacterized protein n=1 Tax=Microbacterium trichothecenolyticum TaxID=69370 RepID=A0A0M2HKV2_MICTR|nr:hypothetical protein [Microbacterium trichothecenolyticum]KJL45002.1 hypothetical protein RS82_00512 [Microbacterium trichothecenolyticum]
MNTTTTSPRAAAGRHPDSIVAWDRLEATIDRLADILDERLAGHDDQLVCSLQFPEAEALAEVLDAGRHTHTAARLMHRWALTEPDWDDDRAHEEILRSWLELDHQPQRPGVGR